MERGSIFVSVSRRIAPAWMFVAAGISFPATALAQPDRAQYSFKGDLFVWPYVKVKWDNRGTPGDDGDDQLLLDTLITLVNDDTVTRKMKFFYVDGRTWERRNTTLCLTGNQPAYFSAWDGRGAPPCLPETPPPTSQPPTGLGGVPPFSGLNPMGLPDGSNPDHRRVEGFIVGWTIDANGCPIGTNQIAAGATIVDYEHQAAWAYRAWSFRSNFTGCKPNDPSILRLNGQPGEYQAAPCDLLVDYWRPLTGAFCPASFNAGSCTQDFELALVNMIMDFRALPDHDLDGNPGEPVDDMFPPTNELQLVSWDEIGNELSGGSQCLVCWDNNLASIYPSGINIFLNGNPKATALVRCGPPNRCIRPPSAPHSQIQFPGVTPVEMPIVGVAQKIITFQNGRVERAASALTLVRESTTGFIVFDPETTSPPFVRDGASGAMTTDGEAPPTRLPRGQ